MTASSELNVASTTERLPSVRIAPMRAMPGPLPANPESFAFEFRWEGYRTLLRWDGHHLQLRNRTHQDLLPLFPEVAALVPALNHPLLLDGTIVALDETGSVDASMIFARGQSRRHPVTAWDPARWSVVYVIFDLLHFDGHGLLTCTWQERRDTLESLVLHGPNWATPPAYANYAPLMATTRIRGGHGIVAKCRHGVYVPGTVSPDWVDIDIDACDCLVVGGYQLDQQGIFIHALLLGFFSDTTDAAGGILSYAGMVITDHHRPMIRELHHLLTAYEARKSPFNTTLSYTDLIWCQPSLVVEVANLTWTGGGRFSHAQLQRLRPEIDPHDVLRPLTSVQQRRDHR